MARWLLNHIFIHKCHNNQAPNLEVNEMYFNHSILKLYQMLQHDRSLSKGHYQHVCCEMFGILRKKSLSRLLFLSSFCFLQFYFCRAPACFCNQAKQISHQALSTSSQSEFGFYNVSSLSRVRGATEIHYIYDFSLIYSAFFLSDRFC